jgi:hypothetical protein
MASRRWLAPVFAVLCVVPPVFGQAPKAQNFIEEKLKAARLPMPEGVDPTKFNQMRNGNIALAAPTDAERAVLEGMAKQLIYPVTHFEYYTTTEPSNAELSPRPDEKTVGRLLSDLRSRLQVVTPGDNTIPAPKVDFAREFGKAAVKAIDDVLAKGPTPVVRMNAVRMLGVVAESGAPAATERITRLLAEKDKGLPVESLYYALKAAEEAIAMYDPARSANAQNWVTKNMYFELVSLVDDVVQQVPASVAANTHQPDATATGTLTTDPKATPTGPAQLTPEQVATVQAFRLQAVRALAQVKTDVVYDDKREKQRRTLVTLARVAVRDTSLVPIPSNREIAEAVFGLANATPTDMELDAKVLAVAMARGVTEFSAPKASAARGGDTGPQLNHWKVTGARLKSAFQTWDTVAVARSRLDQPSKALIRNFSQTAIAQVFDPLSKQSDNGTVVGLAPEDIDKWRTTTEAELKGLQLYKDSDKTKLNPR